MGMEREGRAAFHGAINPGQRDVPGRMAKMRAGAGALARAENPGPPQGAEQAADDDGIGVDACGQLVRSHPVVRVRSEDGKNVDGEGEAAVGGHEAKGVYVTIAVALVNGCLAEKKSGDEGPVPRANGRETIQAIQAISLLSPSPRMRNHPLSMLSAKSIPPRDRLIFALDVPAREDALAWIDRLGDAVTFYKLGLEFCMSGQYFAVLEELVRRGKKVFADLKFADVPATVRGAVENLARSGAHFLTLNATSGVYREAAPVKGELKLLAVTVLTSMGPEDLAEIGWPGSMEDLVSLRARRAIDAGMDGLICSGHEAARLRAELGGAPLIVTPGIRPSGERPPDDQKRVMTVREAFQAGADYIVVGRPIRKAADPRAAALAMQEEIAAIFR